MLQTTLSHLEPHLLSQATHGLRRARLAIYFTHDYLLSIIRSVKPMVGIGIVQSPWLWYLFVTGGMILACLALALLFKKLLPDYSRYVIGY